MPNLYNEFHEYMQGQPVISTHSHHLPDGEFFPHEIIQPYSLNALLNHTYLSPEWCEIPLDNSLECRRGFINSLKYNSYYIWLQKSLRHIYSMDEDLNEQNWDQYSLRIANAHKDKEFHIKLLKNECNYKSVVLDTFWHPGANNGSPELFTPTYRIDMYMYGWNANQTCNNGGNPLLFHKDQNPQYSNIDEYIDFARKMIIMMKSKGCVALKSAIAYHRGNDFKLTTKDRAKVVFEKHEKNLTVEDIKCFQDYTFHQLCQIAAEVNLPFQCHSGMALLDGSNAINMLDVFEHNPNTKFVLFHGNYPWIDDYLGILHNYHNVYPDICWMPLLSTSRSVLALKEIIEIGNQNRICWGCDTWTSEESLGALMALQHVLSKVMADLVNDNYLNKTNAFELIDNILYNNPKKLYLK